MIIAILCSPSTVILVLCTIFQLMKFETIIILNAVPPILISEEIIFVHSIGASIVLLLIIDVIKIAWVWLDHLILILSEMWSINGP